LKGIPYNRLTMYGLSVHKMFNTQLDPRKGLQLQAKVVGVLRTAAVNLARVRDYGGGIPLQISLMILIRIVVTLKKRSI